MYRELLEQLIAYPQRGQVRIDFDLKNKTFSLSIPIFSARTLPSSIKQFVEARKSFTFRPHRTSYQIEGQKVLLVQEIPFEANFQESLRKQVDEFWKMSKHCHRMLSEIAIEEKYKDALSIDSHFQE